MWKDGVPYCVDLVNVSIVPESTYKSLLSVTIYPTQYPTTLLTLFPPLLVSYNCTYTGMPSKSLPIPIWSTPATLRMWSTWSAKEENNLEISLHPGLLPPCYYCKHTQSYRLGQKAGYKARMWYLLFAQLKLRKYSSQSWERSWPSQSLHY